MMSAGPVPACGSAEPADSARSASASPPAGASGRIVTVPNLISAARILCIPWFCWLLFGVGDRWAAALLWGALGASDWVDGWWARRFDAVSDLGKLLDPLTDRAVVVVALAAVGIDGSVPWWLVAPVLFRDVLVSAAAMALGMLGAGRIDVIWWGKCATFGIYAAFPLLLAGSSDIGAAGMLRAAGWVCAVPSLILSYFSAALYVPAGSRALRELREGRASA